MLDIAKLFSVLALISYLLRKKFRIGSVLLAASALLALLYVMSPHRISMAIAAAVTNQVTIKLTLSLTLIRVIELLLRENNVLRGMMEASKSLFRNRKLIIISMPLLIGMLPSLGGAYFSAPMVEESTKGLKMSKEEKGFINFWFRHPWEFALPLYPGLLLASAISGMQLRALILANLVYAVTMLITGFIFSMKGTSETIDTARVSREGLLSFLPITSIILLVVLFNVELQMALLLLSVALFLYYRYSVSRIFSAIRHGLSLDVVLLILGVMLFKELMEMTGAVNNIGELLLSWGVPLMPLLVILPFISGLLTGVTVGFVSSTFPLLIHLMPGFPIGAVSLAFASGFIGVLMSPVHVCLVLTREYFSADMWGIYRKILPACAILFVVAVIEYIILR
jgi:integral membrane protein (TIGR00529 family)